MLSSRLSRYRRTRFVDRGLIMPGFRGERHYPDCGYRPGCCRSAICAADSPEVRLPRCPRNGHQATARAAPFSLWATRRYQQTRPSSAQKRPQTISATFVIWLQRRTLAITNRNDTRDSTQGRSMHTRGEPRAGTHIRRSMRERSRRLGRTRRNTQGHSGHSLVPRSAVVTVAGAIGVGAGCYSSDHRTSN